MGICVCLFAIVTVLFRPMNTRRAFDCGSLGERSAKSCVNKGHSLWNKGKSQTITYISAWHISFVSCSLRSSIRNALEYINLHIAKCEHISPFLEYHSSCPGPQYIDS